MIKVYLTKGLPASGKTTWAKNMVLENPNTYKRVNKDDLREMLDASKFSRNSEDFVLKIRDRIILDAIENGKHVIVDDTNLEQKHENHIREIIKGKAQLVIKDFTDVPVSECIFRDSIREKTVGKKVIQDMYRKYLHKDVKPPEFREHLETVIICDLDGTLALLNGRNPYDASTCENDILNEAVYFVIKHKPVIFVSGRTDKFRIQTEAFLAKHNLGHHPLFMRKEGDVRKDCIVKQEIYDNEIKDKYNVRFVLDDRASVVSQWRANGLICFQVDEGNF